MCFYWSSFKKMTSDWDELSKMKRQNWQVSLILPEFPLIMVSQTTIFTVFFIASRIRHDFYTIRGCDQFLSLLFDLHVRLPIDCLFRRFWHDTVLVWDYNKHHHKHLLTAFTVFQTVMTTSERGSWRDVLWTNWVFWTKMTRHGGRHKSVWDLSRRVWEATRGVYSGSTRGSRRHRSRYWNGGERPCQFVSRSVFLRESIIKVASKIQTAR